MRHARNRQQSGRHIKPAQFPIPQQTKGPQAQRRLPALTLAIRRGRRRKRQKTQEAHPRLNHRSYLTHLRGMIQRQKTHQNATEEPAYRAADGIQRKMLRRIQQIRELHLGDQRDHRRGNQGVAALEKKEPARVPAPFQRGKGQP